MQIRLLGSSKLVQGKAEALATSLVEAIITTFEQIREGQGHLFQDLGQTTQARFDLSIQLSTSLYESGLPQSTRISKRKLHRCMSEGELQAVLYGLLCGDSRDHLTRQTCTRLLQRPEFRAYVQPRSSRDTTRTARHLAVHPATSDYPASPTADNDPLPEMPQSERSHLRRAAPYRTGRTTGRTGWHYERSV